VFVERQIESRLIAWKNEERRQPLLVRGARQIGKSFTIEKFGREHFESAVTVDFDLYPEFAKVFEGALEPREICTGLSVIANREIVPGKTLLFLDEIQQCPRAILALRYFHERLPALHVIGAGSLLEFALSAENMRMPVGRIRYLHMFPLTFAEFLVAVGQDQALRAVESGGAEHPVPEAIHARLLTLLKTYLVLGGMPAVIREYLASGNMAACARIQASLAQTYRDDFGKYATRARLPELRKLFAAVPKMVGQKFKYAAVDDSIHSRALKEALDLLEKAGVVYRVKRTSGAGLPFEAGADDRNFKVIFLDVGLMQSLCGLGGDLLAADDILAVHAGAVAEQFVGQELRAHADPDVPRGLYHWAREARTSNAEVDYLLSAGSKVLPLEVKAGKSGTLKSLHLFLSKYGTPLGVRVSQHNRSLENSLLSVPLYAMHTLEKSVRETLAGRV
jgi:uncharacterized protein